jgi:UDP-3-O-[3-hydroxymyristoyl] glucosamine N-acyltransferase
MKSGARRIGSAALRDARGAARPLRGSSGRGAAPSSSTAAAEVHPSAVVLTDVHLGEAVVVGAGCVVGPDVQVGRGSVLGAGCVVALATLGDNVVLHPGAKVGQGGFGFHPAPAATGAHVAKPQTLRVVIEDNVQVG